MAQRTHKSLQDTFAPNPQRGNRLQGLLKSAPAQLPSPPPGEATGETVDPPASDARIHEKELSPALPSPSAGRSQADAVPKTDRKTNGVQQETGPTSVYLRTKAYRELVDKRQKRFRSYAQTVYDAFAFIRDQARDEEKDPIAVLARLFEANDADDPWLMPEPRSARNSAEPTVEAKIAFKAHERQWVQDRMAEIGATHLSPFLAAVLEHYLLHGKK